jgi:GntR family transcriptional regulator, rspAB operon transcriptional repressor
MQDRDEATGIRNGHSGVTTRLDKTLLDKTWLEKTWVEKTWLDKTWLDMERRPSGELRAAPGGARKSKANLVHATLRQAIISGELSPETPIDKVALCERFRVSRLTVTSAIERLAFEGLVDIEPQRGSYVTRIRLGDVKQWMLVRRLLECEIVAQAAATLSQDWIDLLARNLAYQEAAMTNADLDGFYQLDLAFHGLLIEGLLLHRIGDVLDSVRTHIDRTRRMLLPEPGRPLATLKEHQSIHALIAARDRAGAMQAMAKHLDRVMSELQSFEGRHPDFFS